MPKFSTESYAACSFATKRIFFPAIRGGIIRGSVFDYDEIVKRFYKWMTLCGWGYLLAVVCMFVFVFVSCV